MTGSDYAHRLMVWERSHEEYGIQWHLDFWVNYS